MKSAVLHLLTFTYYYLLLVEPWVAKVTSVHGSVMSFLPALFFALHYVGEDQDSLSLSADMFVKTKSVRTQPLLQHGGKLSTSNPNYGAHNSKFEIKVFQIFLLLVIVVTTIF